MLLLRSGLGDFGMHGKRPNVVTELSEELDLEKRFMLGARMVLGPWWDLKVALL